MPSYFDGVPGLPTPVVCGVLFTNYHYFLNVIARVHIAIRGTVQGVGFRPFIYRLAAELELKGWVLNSPQGVFIESEGAKEVLDSFILRIGREKPPHASIQSMEASFLDPCGYTSFDIRASRADGELTALVLPDIATCPDCLADILDETNRRYRYPFTNCTNCGPRFTIIERLPYDRPNTSMKQFTMCDDCQREYEDPSNRRFHAQPIACPRCGPQLALWDENGDVIAVREEALMGAAERLRQGHILALKGLGGFQLIVDASNEEAVRRLRMRKHREEKPFALMARDSAMVAALCSVSALEERALSAAEAPIVLLRKRASPVRSPISAMDSPVAPNNACLGVMLPSTPLHHLLLRELPSPVIATSGNIADEPICIDERDALKRLKGIADVYLVHDRPIIRHADDSIVRLVLERELVLRRARGFSPLPVSVASTVGEVLAVGAHLKNTVAVAKGHNIFLSQHIGDLETKQSLDAFHNAVNDLSSLFAVHPSSVVSDLHPDYLSTQFARASGLPVQSVQHHHAHIASCMADNGIEGPVLGVSWDGTGYGTDGTVWGGEFLFGDGATFERVVSFRQFRLPGGDRAVKEPRRSALGLLYAMTGPEIFERRDLPTLCAFSTSELTTLRPMLERGINAPLSSSAGRLFDAVASITGISQRSRHEGQAAMALEFAASSATTDEWYRLPLLDPEGASLPRWLDWSELVNGILRDLGSPHGVIAAKFHNGLTECIVQVAKHVGQSRIVLSGGCFQNRYLTERTVRRLREEGFHPYWHQRVPPNDGGISLGQIAMAAARARRGAA